MDFLVGHCPDRFHGARVKRKSEISGLRELWTQARAENGSTSMSSVRESNAC